MILPNIKLVVFNTGELKDVIAFVTNEDKKYLRVTPVKGNPLGSLLVEKAQGGYTYHELPRDLFNPERLPARDEDGYLVHPDWQLIHNQLGEDDEGKAATDLILKLGYRLTSIDFFDDSTEEYQIKFDIDGDVSGWEPSRPKGEGWVLLSIHQHDDGVAAAYLRKSKNVVIA